MRNTYSALFSLAREALDAARRNSDNFDVSSYTSAVRRFMPSIPHCLKQLATNTNELLQLEQRGYESAARMHLDLARSQEGREIRRRNISAFDFYAGISERPLAFFGTDTDELKRLSE